MTAAGVTVVVPTYDGAAFLPACLDALRAQTLAPAAVIVVDDGSRGGAMAALAAARGDVRVIARERNGGFAAAVNHGLRAAATPLVALLNDDAVAEPGWLEALVRAAGAHPECDAFASRMLAEHPEGAIDSAGLALAHGFVQVSRGGGLPDGPRFDAPAEVLGACAGAALYRKALFARIGFFDERYRVQWEDYDVALRALAAGSRALYVPEARVRHRGSATLGRNSWRSVYHYRRNLAPTLWKSVPPTVLRRERRASRARSWRHLALYLRRGRFFAALCGSAAGSLEVLRRRLSEARERRPASGADAARLLAFLDEGSRWRAEQRAVAAPPVPSAPSAPSARSASAERGA